MSAIPGLRALLSLHPMVALECGFCFRARQLTPAYFSKRLCSIATASDEPNAVVNQENESLLENLNLLGVDVKEVRQRQPGVLRKSFTNEQALAQFLQDKGASDKVIASIICRFPRAITRSSVYLEERWALWRNIFPSDEKIVSILNRSPESFFRTSDNKNLKDNIDYLSSLGLNTKTLHRLLFTAPRTFSNSSVLNKQMVDFLENVCLSLGGKDPKQFAKAVITKNPYILIRSTKSVKASIDILRAFLNAKDSELLTFFEGPGGGIMHLSTECLKKNLSSLVQKMLPLNCERDDIKNMITRYPLVLYIGADTLSTKLDCLLEGGITIQQILEKPRVLDYSSQNITARIKELQKVGYDFQESGISILDSSQKRFDAKLERLTAASNNKV